MKRRRQIRPEALIELREDDRCRLAQRLLESVPRESDQRLADAWDDEVLDRVKAVDRGEVVGHPLEERAERGGDFGLGVDAHAAVLPRLDAEAAEELADASGIDGGRRGGGGSRGGRVGGCGIGRR